jgi:hypothetical protein
MLNAFASKELLNNKFIQVTEQEAKLQIKEQIAKEISRATGLNEFNLKIDIEINEKKLKDNLGVSEEDWKKIDGLRLPGLFVEGKEGMTLSPLRQATKEDIIFSLNKLEIEFSYYDINYKSEYLQQALQKILKNNYPQLSDTQFKINVNKDAAPYPKKETGNQFMEALSKPLQIDMKQGAFQEFWDQNYKMVLLGFAGIILTLSLVSTFLLRGGLGHLSETIKTKTVQTSSGQPNLSAPNLTENYPSQNREINSIPDRFESYVHASQFLRNLIQNESKIFNEIILLKIMVEDFSSLTILLDVLPSEKKDIFLKNMESEKSDRFKHFIVTEGTGILKDENFLMDETVKLIKLIKIASLSPTELYSIVVTDLVQSMTVHEIKNLLAEAKEKEKFFLCDMVDESKLAELLQNDHLVAMDFQHDGEGFSKTELLDFLIKASQFKRHKKVKIKQEKLENIYAFIQTDKAEALADAIGLSASLRFEALFSQFEEESIKYLQAMDFNNLSQLFPLLTESMRETTLTALPALLAERLKFAKKSVSSQSLKIKGDFYFYLRSLAKTDETTAHSDLKLVA